MTRYLAILTIVAASCSNGNRYTGIPSSIDFMEFREPSRNYRAAPFYSLNDALDSAELDRQITEFARGGYGGVYLHSRTGLLTEYLGDDWWTAMDAGVIACERNGIYAWFYDEDKWPSGFAGGLVPVKSEDFHARCLMRLRKTADIPEGASLVSSDSSWNYVCYKARYGNAWFNGTCYTDLLNPAMVKEFIASSYKPYADRYRKYIGSTALGIFTDEPQFFPITDGIENDGVQPFSPVIPGKFREDNGYDLLPVMGALFDTVPGYAKIRLDYYRTLSLQMEASFSRQIGEFCGSRNLLFTGHYNGEDGITSVRNNVGDLMIQLRNMHQPGMDHLGLHIDGALYAARNISSVANQYGISRRLCEAYGISGQNMNFEDRAWIASFLTLNGINHLCPHLALYSMKGTRKRDYPPTLSSQQPYWGYNGLLEEYTARLCYVAATGKYEAEYLVLNPLESEFIEGGATMKGWSERMSRILNVLQILQENHRDYDLGDEQVISEKGSVNGKVFSVGNQSYKGIIMPYMLSLRKSTFSMLEKFAANGGTIIALGFPSYIDGEKDNARLKRLGEIVKPAAESDLASILQYEVVPAVQVIGENSDEVWISRRTAEGHDIIQVTNISRLRTIRCRVQPAGKGTDMVLLDPAYGKGYTIRNNGGYELILNPAATVVLADRKAVKGFVSSGEWDLPGDGKDKAVLSGEWSGRRADPNALTLDFASFSCDGGKTFSKPEPVLGIHERFTRDRYDGPLIMVYEFFADTLPSACNLVVEQPEMYSAIRVNGNVVKYDSSTFYRDHSFRSVPVTGFIRKGRNDVSLYLDYKAPLQESRDPRERYGSEIESIYLTGDFAVRTENSSLLADRSQHDARGFLVPKPVHHYSAFAITKEKSLFSGDLADQGYPFYNGSFILEKNFMIDSKVEGKRYFLSFPLSEAIIISVSLNGRDLPPLAWSPWETELTDALIQGENRLTVTVVNSLRNLLGPHHNAEGELIAVSPESFGGGSTWTTSRQGESDWYDRRLKGRDSTNIWRDDYCIIPFGLLKDPVIVEREMSSEVNLP